MDELRRNEMGASVDTAPAGPGGVERSSEDPKGVALDVLRLGIGLIWFGNLIFVADPANGFFASFPQVALSFGPTTLGGPGLASFAAAHAPLFAWGLAGVTVYLAVAFTFGLTTRLACVVGSVTSVALLATQFGSTFGIPGGTDVGPHPLYLLAYVVLYVGRAGSHFAIDARWANRTPRVLRSMRRARITA